jgi:hypothetical protein
MGDASKDSPFVAQAVPFEVEPAPPSEVQLSGKVSPKELRAFIGRPETQDVIRAVVVRRVGAKVP